MARARTPAASTDDLVLQALKTVATAVSPPRLVGPGEPPALFPTKTGANRAPLGVLTGETPLVGVSGKGPTEEVFLTPAGYHRVASALPPENVGPSAKLVAGRLPLAERIAFLEEVMSRTPDSFPELSEELEAANASSRAQQEEDARAAERERQRDVALKAAANRVLELVEQRKQDRIASLLERLKAEGWTAPGDDLRPPEGEKPKPRDPDARRPLVRPTTTADGDFRRDAAERLVSSWRDAVEMRKDEAQRFLETAMDNIVGLKRIGEEGDEAPFDGAAHEAVPGVFTDQLVRVTRSGWALEEDADRDYVIQKARVAKP